MASHHKLGKFLFIRFTGLYRLYVSSLAEYRHTITDGKYLMQLMCDNDHRLSVFFHILYHGKEVLTFLWGKHSSGFIKNQYIRSSVKHLDYLKCLLFGDAHIIDFFTGVYDKSVFVTDILYLARDFFPVQLFAGIYSHYQVLSGRKNIYQLKMLVNHTYLKRISILRVPYGDRLTVYEYLTLIRKIDARKHIHKRSLSTSVFTKE